MIGLFTRLINPRRAFRPEVEALLDAEMARHREQIDKLTAYAVEQQEAQLAQSVKSDDVGDISGGTRSQAAVEGLGETSAD